MKKTIAILLALAMMLSMAACGGGASSSAAATSGSTAATQGTPAAPAAFDGCLNIGIPGDPADLSPFSTMSVGRMYTLESIYEYLAIYEEKDGAFVGQLAKDIDVSDDALTVVVTLYDYIKDAAGNAITADDVVFCYNKAVEANCSISLGYMDSVEKVDDYTVQFNLNNQVVDGWQGVLSGVPIISQTAYEASDDGFLMKPVTTSAYQVTEFITGSTLKLQRRDDYWQTDESLCPIKHNVEAIQFDVIMDSAQMAIALETGTIEIAEGISSTEVERFMEGGEDADNFTVFNTLDNRTYCLLFNCNDDVGVFAGKKELRQAIAYAIDVPGIITAILNGGATQQTTWGSYTADDFDPSWVDSYYDYNLDKAKELMKEAGVAEGELTLRMACTNNKVLSSSLELIQAYLMQIGINTEINVVDAGLFDSIKYDKDEWDLLLDTIGGKNIALLSKSMNSVDKSYLNVCFVNDPKMQSMAETILMTPTHTAENVKEWVEYMNEQMYAYGMFNVFSYVAASNSIESITWTSRACVYPGDVVIAG